jgi:hypothetical protein
MTCQEPIVGGDCKLYYNSGTVATPVWAEIAEIGDLSVADFSNSVAEVKTRASEWDAGLPARKKVAVEFSYLYKADTTVWEYLRDMFLNRTIAEFAVADGAIATAGTEALRLAVFIENFPITQNLEEVSMVDTVRLAHAYMCESDVRITPEWMEVSA